MDKEKIVLFHRENIIKAADELFQEFGLENTTMNMIAKLSNYSTATIYVYFKNKEEIFDCLIYNCMQELYESFLATSNSEIKFIEKYNSICESVVGLQSKYPLYFEGMIGNINMDFANNETPEICKQIYDLGNKLNEELLKIVECGITENIIKPDLDKMKLIFYMWSCVIGIVRMSKQKKDYFILNNVTQKELLEFSFSNLLEGIKNK